MNRRSTDQSPLTPSEVSDEFATLQGEGFCPRIVHNPSSPCSCYVKTQYTAPTHTLTMAIVYCDLHDARKLTEHSVSLTAQRDAMREALSVCISNLEFAARVLQVPDKCSFNEDIDAARAALAIADGEK